MKLHYKHYIAIIFTVVLFLDRLDLTIVNSTFPTVARYFNISIVSTDWLSLAFLMALAITIPISSWLAEHVGSKKIYISAMILFGLGSTCCAFATSLNQLILLRFIQGIGGGMLIPVGMTMLYQLYSKRDYANITSLVAIPALVAPAIAPFFGGLLLQTLGWRWVFVCSGPICLALAIIAMIIIKEHHHKNKYPLDWLGFILSSAMLLCVFYGLSKLGDKGLHDSAIIPLLLLPPLLYYFIKTENNHSHPLIDLSFFKHALFARANLIQLCFQSCHFGAIFLIGLFFQAGIGFSAILAGLMMGMQALGAMTINRYSVHLFNTYGSRRSLMIGLSGITIISPMIMLINKPTLLTAGLCLFFVRGLFSGLCGTPIQTLSIISFDKKEIGTVNSIFNACRQVSISLGVAISSLLISAGLRLTHLTGVVIPHDKVFAVFSAGFWAISVMGIVAIVITYNLPPLPTITAPNRDDAILS